jgi:hypothetical protein
MSVAPVPGAYPLIPVSPQAVRNMSGMSGIHAIPLNHMPPMQHMNPGSMRVRTHPQHHHHHQVQPTAHVPMQPMQMYAAYPQSNMNMNIMYHQPYIHDRARPMYYRPIQTQRYGYVNENGPDSYEYGKEENVQDDAVVVKDEHCQETEIEQPEPESLAETTQTENNNTNRNDMTSPVEKTKRVLRVTLKDMKINEKQVIVQESHVENLKVQIRKNEKTEKATGLSVVLRRKNT